VAAVVLSDEHYPGLLERTLDNSNGRSARFGGFALELSHSDDSHLCLIR
jgi:hypothetical protein